jgi:hypothetical protein
MKSFLASAVMMAVSLLAASALLTACGSSETVHNRLVSPEQSAADLKRALDSGAITQEEDQEEMEKLRDAD